MPTDPGDTGNQDMWVMKLDSCGCWVAGCDSACQGLVSVDEELQITNDGLRVFAGTPDLFLKQENRWTENRDYLYAIKTWYTAL